MERLTSAHVTLTTAAAGQSVTAQGDETLSGGKLTTLDMTEQIGGLTIGIRIIGDVVYAKLPPEAGALSAKPWVKASPTSTDPVMRQLASAISSVEADASVDAYTSLAQGATDVRDLGSSTVNGVSATRYSLIVDVSKLPTTALSTQILKQAGISTLPADLWLDGQGRLVQVVENLTVQQKAVSTKIGLSKFNDAVTITAPPAGQVSG